VTRGGGGGGGGGGDTQGVFFFFLYVGTSNLQGHFVHIWWVTNGF